MPPVCSTNCVSLTVVFGLVDVRFRDSCDVEELAPCEFDVRESLCQMLCIAS